MAEVHIQWADGRTERRGVLPAQVLTVGDSRLPVAKESIPLGHTIRIGRTSLPYVRVRVHGGEVPYMVLLTKASGAILPSARSAPWRRSGTK